MQILNLNKTVKCTLGVSKIHGIGVIALRNLKKGEKLYCWGQEHKWLKIPFDEFYRINPEVRELITTRWPTVALNAPFMHPNSEAWLVSFMNHEDDCNYYPETDSAKRDIKKGEEVTEDYRKLKCAKEIYKFL